MARRVLPSAVVGKVIDHRPTVECMQIEQTDGICSRNGRTDVYFAVALRLDGQPVNGTLHLMKHAETKRRDKNWNASILLNEQAAGESVESCPLCSGNSGVSTAETPGLTALAVAAVLCPLLEQQGFTLAKHGRKGGWWAFDMRCRDFGEVPDSQNGLPLGYIAWTHEIDCPMHGRFHARTIEFAAD